MMAENDVEANKGSVVADDGDSDTRTKWVGKALQRQNRCFGVALTLCLLFAAGFVAFQTISPAEESPIDEFDNQAGTITNDAKNAKIQKYLDAHRAMNHTGRFWYHTGGGQNPFAGRYQGDEQGGHLRDYTTALAKARAKQDAIFKHWQRNHPGEEVPEKYKKLADAKLAQTHYDAAMQHYQKKYGRLPSGAGDFNKKKSYDEKKLGNWKKAHGFDDDLQTSRLPHGSPVNPRGHAASKGKAKTQSSPSAKPQSLPQEQTEDSKEEPPSSASKKPQSLPQEQTEDNEEEPPTKKNTSNP